MASKGFAPTGPEPTERPPWFISPSDITDRSANPIGRGGFGEVFTGSYFGTKVAIKQLLGTCNKRQLAEYNHEISIWKQLSYPHVLPLLGACDQDEDGNPIPPFMVSPFMPNGTLLNHVSDPNTHVPLEEKLRLLRQVASGMAYLHGRRIIHGDLKAANVLLDGLNNAVVTDFGMSRTKHTSASLNPSKSNGPNGGTDGYMAPEMLDEDDPSGTTMKTDVFAFAIMMHEVLNDANPVWVTANGQAMKPFQILSQLIQHKRPKRFNGIPDDVWALIERCWAQDPADRPAFPDILAALQPYNRAAAPAVSAPATAKAPAISQVSSNFTTLSVDNYSPSQPSSHAELTFEGINNAIHRLPDQLVSRAKQGDPAACLEAAKLVSEGLPAHHSDWKLAAQLFGAAADRGNLEASFQMAWFALIGQEIPQSDHYAFWFWEEVSSRSTDPVLKPIATHMVGWMYYFGRGTQQDQQKGIKIIRDNESDGFKFGEAECLARWNTASSDSPASCKFFSLCQLGSDRDWLCKHLMGVCLSLGFGTAKDEKKAAGIFEQLATDGHSDSQYWVGEYLYRSGKVSSDYKKAFEWYYKSADQGNSYGQWKVGRYYWNAIGAPRNNAKAIEWLRKSAEQGNRYGQYDLGDCYESGEGVPKDIGTAIYWYRKSADQGHEYAIRNLKELGK